MFMIHADTWNSADPKKIIDLIPVDLRPYTVLIISMSIDHDPPVAGSTVCNWKRVENGYETAKSWLRTAAENGVWAMIQPSSGGFSHFPDYPIGTDLEKTLYGEFFRDYPNFLGFNYAEQFWGFDGDCSGSPKQRQDHWSNLLKLTNKYGGYLAVSFTGGFYAASINPVAMVKSNPALAAALGSYAKNFIIEEKFTSSASHYDMQSVTLGMFLSGYAGHYGNRPDRTGWTGPNGAAGDYPVPAGSPHLIEHLLLTGQTVIDGPELIWIDSIRSLSPSRGSDGFYTRRWELAPQFKNIHADVYRKILDGTLRILSRKEVIDRTKVVIVNDVTSGDDRAKFASPETLFSGLYLMDGDGTFLNQKNWWRKTGRYPAIPTVWQLTDVAANGFQVQLKKSSYAMRWPDVASKVREFDSLFPQEYTGDIYAGRQDNTWVTYNPFKTDQLASGNIPLKYNSCSSVDLRYARYTTGVITEYADRLSIYLTNYDSESDVPKNDRIVVNGATSTPSFSFKDRGEHTASVVSGGVSNGSLTLDVNHNGPLEISIECKGAATDRLTTFKSGTVVSPAPPPLYTGPRQYEAENFDYKNIGALVDNGTRLGINNFQGLGYVDFGTSASASIRGKVYAAAAGSYQLQTRYSGVAGGNVDLYVNGQFLSNLALTATATTSDWATNGLAVTFNAGENVIELRATNTRSAPLYIDNFVVYR